MYSTLCGSQLRDCDFGTGKQGQKQAIYRARSVRKLTICLHGDRGKAKTAAETNLSSQRLGRSHRLQVLPLAAL